ncbi:MAG TPA: GIY-YIG nuclease family protein, partial [Isosphaeraceae bacterium]|nr:GIY-YIG nuclease family protein [Isosphaeraceae bacterium]
QRGLRAYSSEPMPRSLGEARAPNLSEACAPNPSGHARRSLGEGGRPKQSAPMHYVYLIRSTDHPDQTYIGCTENLEQRLAAHNAGRSPHTAKFKPWAIVAFIGFADRDRATEFEKYMKSGSGRAFANKHLWGTSTT